MPERQWFVENWIPHRTVTNLSGAGGSGKTEIVLQLIAAASLRTEWFSATGTVCLSRGYQPVTANPVRPLTLYARLLLNRSTRRRAPAALLAPRQGWKPGGVKARPSGADFSEADSPVPERETHTESDLAGRLESKRRLCRG